jgi:hypothetical protein
MNNTAVYLYHDQEKEYLNIKAYRRKKEALDDLKIIIEKSLKITLTDADLKKLSVDTRKFVEAKKGEVRATFQFPNATETFNLESLGVQFAPIDKALTEISNVNYHFEVVNGSFDEMQSELDRIKSEADIHTANERQAELVTISKDICEGLNMLLAFRAMQPDDFGFLHRLSGGLIHYQEKKFTIAPKLIRQL